MNTNGKWKLRPGKRPIIPPTAKPKTASEWIAEREAGAAREARRVERTLPPIVRMSRRFGADRRKAFLLAYRRGGNAQGAARAVKVAWDTVAATLEADVAFRADYETAKAAAHSGRLSAALGALDKAAAQAIVRGVLAEHQNEESGKRLRHAALRVVSHVENGEALLRRLANASGDLDSVMANEVLLAGL